MNPSTKLHLEAMAIMNDAFAIDEHTEAGQEKFREACRVEKEAADLVEKKEENEPSRGMLYYSASVLAWRGKDFNLALRLCAEGLTGFPPKDIEQELLSLLSDIKFAMKAQNESSALLRSETIMRFDGGAVDSSSVPLTDLLKRIGPIQRIIEKSSNRLSGKAFTDKKYVHETRFEFAEAASFCCKIEVAYRHNAQIPLLAPTPEAVLQDVLGNIQLLEQSNFDKIKENMPDESYYNYFVKTARHIFPDDSAIQSIGFIANQSNFSLRKKQSEMQEVAEEQVEKITQNPDYEGGTNVYRGILSIANMKKNLLLLTLENGDEKNFHVSEGIKEYAKNYFGELVNVFARAKKRTSTQELLDITLVDSE